MCIDPTKPGRVAGTASDVIVVSHERKGMPMTIIETATPAETAVREAPGAAGEQTDAPEVEVLVEEISIDGMCGVY